MAKPTRRERRLLAEKGRLAPRRQAARSISTGLNAPAERYSAPVSRVMPAEDAVTIAQEYAYVKSDLVRILLLAVVLVGTMLGLRFVLPQ